MTAARLVRPVAFDVPRHHPDGFDTSLIQYIKRFQFWLSTFSFPSNIVSPLDDDGSTLHQHGVEISSKRAPHRRLRSFHQLAGGGNFLRNFALHDEEKAASRELSVCLSADLAASSALDRTRCAHDIGIRLPKGEIEIVFLFERALPIAICIRQAGRIHSPVSLFTLERIHCWLAG